MEPDTIALAYRVAEDLKTLLTYFKTEAEDAIASDRLDQVVTHFRDERDFVKEIDAGCNELSKHVKLLSEETIPTLFLNKGQKSANLVGIGMVKVVSRWTAQMVNPVAAMLWLREQGNGGVIKQSVHHETLGAMAKDAATAGKPLPSDLFKVGTSNYTSIS